MPSASERIATIVNPGFFPNIRNPYRASSTKSSSHRHPLAPPAPLPLPRRPVLRVPGPPSPDGSSIPRPAPLLAFYAARNSRATSAFPYFLTSLLPYFRASSRPHYSSGCSTPAIASESCDHLERSLLSCFF